MENFHILTYRRWYPFKSFGFTNAFWSVHEETLIATWVVIAIILIASLLVRWAITTKHETVRYCAMSYVRFFMDSYEQSIKIFSIYHVSFLLSLFTFILLCTITPSFIPWLEEPTSDLNTTLALGLTSFFFVQIEGIKAHGVLGYLKEYFTPVFMFPLHIIGKLVSIISLSFRLFGNIFGGSVITKIYHAMIMNSLIGEFVGMILGANLVVTLFFGLFEGLIQAFVFFTLTLTYLSIGLQEEPTEGEAS